jgi:hypothetical protein
MAARWHLPLTLWGGTQDMRRAGEQYLPKQLKESNTAYERRVNRSFLFNAFKKTVQSLTGKVFSKEISLQDDVPPQIVDWTENVDLTGRSLNLFARDVFEGGAKTGLGHILVDMQRNQPGASLADERAANLRPYMKFIAAESLIGWRSKIINGQPALTQIRIKDDQEEEDGEFGEVLKQRIRVIEPSQFRVFELQDDEWALVDAGPMTLGKIPLATFYGQREGFLLAEPPLEELAWMNAAHWQSNSDQRQILHIARVPILFGAGLDGKKEYTIGSDYMIDAPLGSELKYVEHSGAAIASGRQDLVDIEERMRIMGVEPLMPKTGNVTATAKAIDSAAAHSQLQAMTIGLGDAIEQAFDFMADWANLGEGGSVKVNDDFGLAFQDQVDLDTLIKARQAGDISRETLWAEMKRRNVLMDDFSPEEETERLEDEGPALGLIGREPFGEEGEDAEAA